MKNKFWLNLKYLKKTEKGCKLTKSISKTIAFGLATAMCFTAMFSDFDSDWLPDLSISLNSEADAFYDLTLGQSEVTLKDKEITINNAREIILLSHVDPDEYKEYTINVYRTEGEQYIDVSGTIDKEINGEKSSLSFQGLGSTDSCFEGNFKSDYDIIVGDIPLFRAISTKAEVSKLKLKTSNSAVGSGFLFADTVIGCKDKSLDVDVTVSSESGNFCGIIGCVKEQADVKLTVTNNVTLDSHINPDNDGYLRCRRNGNAGFFCSEVIESKLSISYYTPENDTKAGINTSMLSVISDEEFAGLAVGYAKKSELIVNGPMHLFGQVYAEDAAGGFIGCSEESNFVINGNLIIGADDNSEQTLSFQDGQIQRYYRGLTVNGKNFTGGFAGKTILNSTDGGDSVIDFSRVTINVSVLKHDTNTDNALGPFEQKTVRESEVNGGVFGQLYNKGNSGSLKVSNVSNISLYSDMDKGVTGGLVGEYKADSLAVAFEADNVGTVVNQSVLTDVLGGLIGTAGSDNEGAYIKLSGVTVTNSGTFGKITGGLVGKSSGADFIDIGNNKVSGTFTESDKNNYYIGGLIGSMGKGVIRLSDSVDLSGAVFNSGSKHGQILGYRGDVLVYATDGWGDKFVRPDGKYGISDVAEWGEVLRLNSASGNSIKAITEVDADVLKSDYRGSLTSAVVVFDRVKHIAKIWDIRCSNHVYDESEGNISTVKIYTVRDFAALSLRLSCGSPCASLEFDKDISDPYSCAIEMKKDIDLSRTGITGFLRDDGTQLFKGKLTASVENTCHTVTVAAGESYGIYSDNTPAIDEGSGQIYSHNFNGLIARTENAGVNNLLLSGTMNIKSGTNVGMLIGEATGDDSTKLYNIKIDDESFIYSGASNTGGIIGNSTAAANGDKDNKLIIEQCAYFGTINGSGNGNIGGFLGNTNGNVTVLGNGTEIGGKIILSSGNKAGGIIGVVSGKGSSLDSQKKVIENTIIEIDSVKVDKLTIDATAVTGTSGGFFGYSWDKCSASFTNNTISNSELNTKGLFGGLIYAGSGHWRVGWRKDNAGITYESNNKISGITSNDNPSALFVSRADNRSGNVALFLEIDCLSDGNPSLLIKDNSVSLNIGNDSYFDEIAGRTINGDGNGIVSFCTPDSSQNNTSSSFEGIDRTDCNTYTKQLPTDYKNPNTRYYYDLDDIDFRIQNGISPDNPNNEADKNLEPKVIDNADDLMFYSLYRYSAGYLKNYFKKFDVEFYNSPVIKGTIDLRGYSYYPIEEQGNISIENCTIIFDNESIEKAENKANNKKTSYNLKQHYMMQSGLFVNSTVKDSDISVNVKNVVFKGTIGMDIPDSTGGSGVLFSGKVAGNNGKLFKLDINNVTFDNFAITGFEDEYDAPLLLNSAGTYTNIKVDGIMINNYPEEEGMVKKAASSLMGNIGDENAVGISVIFSNMGLNGKKDKSIFSKASFISSFSYKADSSGLYNFNIGDDKITYGQELSNFKDDDPTGRNPDKQFQYFDNLDTVADGDVVADVKPGFKNDYLRYVYQPESGSGTLHELDINQKSSGILEGCGTADDPYIIAEGGQLDCLQSYLNGQPVSGWEVMFDTDLLHNRKGSSHKKEKHQTFIYSSDSNSWSSDSSSADFTGTDIDNFTEYLRNSYYKICKDEITVGESGTYKGIGGSVISKEAGKTTASFCGVIFGEKNNSGNYPVVKIKSPNTATSAFGGLICYGSGCVIKNLVIDYSECSGENVIMLDGSTSGSGIINAKAYDKGGIDNENVEVPVAQYPENQVFFGGVIGYAFGGDNIIDNVTVKGLDNSVTVTGDYNYLAAVGGYVGLAGGNALGKVNNNDIDIKGKYGGGVVFRNIEDRNFNFNVNYQTGEISDTDNDTENGDEDNHSVPENHAVSANTTADYTTYNFDDTDYSNKALIYDAVKNTTLLENIDQYFYLNPYVGRVLDGYACAENIKLNNTDKNYTVPQIDTTKIEKSLVISDGTVEVKDEQGLWLLSAIVNSGAGSFKNGEYTENAYRYGKVRNGKYTDISASGFENFKSDEEFWGGMRAGKEDKKSILIGSYTETYDSGKPGTLSSDSKGWVLSFADNHVYNMQEYGNGFRGIGTGYTDNITKLVQDRTFSVKTLNGNNSVIEIERKGLEYSEETWWTQAEGLFPVYSFDATECSVNNLTVKGNVKIFYADKDYLDKIYKGQVADKNNVESTNYVTESVEYSTGALTEATTACVIRPRLTFGSDNNIPSEYGIGGYSNAINVTGKSKIDLVFESNEDYIVRYCIGHSDIISNHARFFSYKDNYINDASNINQINLSEIRANYNISDTEKFYVFVIVNYREKSKTGTENIKNYMNGIKYIIDNSDSGTFVYKKEFSTILPEKICSDNLGKSNRVIVNSVPIGNYENIKITKDSNVNAWYYITDSAYVSGVLCYSVNGNFGNKLNNTEVIFKREQILGAGDKGLYVTIVQTYDNDTDLNNNPDKAAQILDTTKVKVYGDGQLIKELTAGGVTSTFTGSAVNTFSISSNKISNLQFNGTQNKRRFMVLPLDDSIKNIRIKSSDSSNKEKQICCYVIDEKEPKTGTNVLFSATGKYDVSLDNNYKNKYLLIMVGYSIGIKNYSDSIDGLSIIITRYNTTEKIEKYCSGASVYALTAYDAFIGEACLGGFGGISAYNNNAKNNHLCAVSDGAQSNQIIFCNFKTENMSVEGGKYCGGFIGQAGQFNRIYRKVWDNQTSKNNYSDNYSPKTIGSIVGDYLFDSCGYTSLKVNGAYAVGGFIGNIKNNTKDGLQRKVTVIGKTEINKGSTGNSFSITRDAIYEYATHTTTPHKNDNNEFIADTGAKYYCYVGAGGIVGYCDASLYINNQDINGDFQNEITKPEDGSKIPSKEKICLELNNLTISAPQISFNSDYGLGAVAGSVINNRGKPNPSAICNIVVNDCSIGTPRNLKYSNIVRTHDSEMTYPFKGDSDNTTLPSYRNYNSGGIFGYTKSIVYVYNCEVNRTTILNSPYSGGIMANLAGNNLYIINTSVKDSIIYNSDVMATTRTSGSGGLIGHLQNDTVLINDTVSGNKIISNGSSGGIAGYYGSNAKVDIRNLKVENNVIATTRFNSKVDVYNTTFEAPTQVNATTALGFKSNETVTSLDTISYSGKAGGIFGSKSGNADEDVNKYKKVHGFNILLNNNSIGYVLNESKDNVFSRNAVNSSNQSDFSEKFHAYSFDDFYTNTKEEMLDYLNNSDNIRQSIPDESIFDSDKDNKTGYDGIIIGNYDIDQFKKNSILKLNIQITGLSVQGDNQPVEYNGNGNIATADSYIIRADYMGSSLSDNHYSPNQNQSGTYVTDNPFIKSGDTVFTSDGISLKARDAILRGLKSENITNDPPNTYAFNAKLKEFASALTGENQTEQTKIELKTFNDNDIEKDRAGNFGNLPVIFIDTNNANDINMAIQKYISVMTGTNQTAPDEMSAEAVLNGIKPHLYTKEIKTYACCLENGNLVKRPDQASIEITGNISANIRFRNKAGMHDNGGAVAQFTMIEIPYKSPIEGDNSVYTLYIPVYVKRILAFSYHVAVLNDTDYHPDLYETAKIHAISNYGESVTAYVSFNYYRTEEEWVKNLAGGENLLWNFKKRIFLGKDKLPDGSLLTLVDHNTGGYAYTLKADNTTIGEYRLNQGDAPYYYVDLTSFKNAVGRSPDDCWENDAAYLCDLLKLDVKQVQSSDDTVAKFVKCQKNEATFRVRNSDSWDYYRPFSETDITKDEEENDVYPDLYTVKVPADVLKRKDARELNTDNIVTEPGIEEGKLDAKHLEESYYLTINAAIADDNPALINNVMDYPLENLDAAGYINRDSSFNMPTSKANIKYTRIVNKEHPPYNANVYMFSNCITQDELKITTKSLNESAVMSSDNNEITVTLENKLRISKSLIISHLKNGEDPISLYQNYNLGVMENNDENKGESVGFDSECTVDYSFKVHGLKDDKWYTGQNIHVSDITDTLSLPADSKFKDMDNPSEPQSLVNLLENNFDESDPDGEKSGINIVCTVNIRYTDAGINKFPEKDVSDPDIGRYFGATSFVSYSPGSLFSSSSNVSGTGGTHYSREKISIAKLTYNADSTVSDSEGQLGINPIDSESKTDISSFVFYDYLGVDNNIVNKSSKIHYEMTLYQKTDNGYGAALDIRQYFMPVSEGKYIRVRDEGSEVAGNISDDGKIITWDIENFDKELFQNTLLIDYTIISGDDTGTDGKTFEEAGQTYANYKVLIRAYLVDKDTPSEHYGEAEDYLIYTHAKNLLEMYIKDSR